MKHIYSFLAGVASISLTVFLTRSLPGYMFLAGFCVCCLSIVLLGRVIGVGRLARFFSNYASPSLNLVPGQSKQPRVADGARSVARGRRELRHMPGAHNDLPAKEIRIRRNPSSAENGNNLGVVNSVDVLSSVQQDVLSALVNLKVPYSQAEEAIRGARGQSFDELFREALTSVNVGSGKSRRAVA